MPSAGVKFKLLGLDFFYIYIYSHDGVSLRFKITKKWQVHALLAQKLAKLPRYNCTVLIWLTIDRKISITRNISQWPCNKSIFPYQTRSTRHAPKTLSTFKAHTRPLRPIAPLPRQSGSFNVTRESIYTIRFDQPKSRFLKLNLIFQRFNVAHLEWVKISWY